jgi:hypothetical protein
MKLFLILSCLLAFSQITLAADKDRKPAQGYGFPQNPPTTSTPTDPSGSGGVTTFSSEDVTAAGGIVNSVQCLVGGSSTYNMNVQGNDIRIARTSAGGEIRYEVYKGQRFVGACSSIYVNGR